MSYEDTRCPCGGKKPSGTMLCDDCFDHLKHRPEMDIYRNPDYGHESRRTAAIILCTLARSRRKATA